MEKTIPKIMLLGVLALVLAAAAPMSAKAEEPCPFTSQGDVAVILADAFGLVPTTVGPREAIEVLNRVGIYPGALGDVLPASETEGWESGREVTNDLFCEQLVYLVWAAASQGSINVDPREAAQFVLSLALSCGINCPGPPPEEVIIIPPPGFEESPGEEEPE